ncbi:hypothetical protein [Gordonia sp. (in: high G+C Gram-positive bacteria)]|uniref:hypothetical protein n=1 Tax=Gordonia sp. (in: high G+C Gram-positive bacteria) TaxID=84139 RepID=UPI002620E712|nr:hypothetical protein [Gordonia sp. (in: high G+C Gram-positive bacteria)]
MITRTGVKVALWALGYDIVAAIDDRPRVIRLWQSLDIPTTIVRRPDWEAAGESYDGLVSAEAE